MNKWPPHILICTCGKWHRCPIFATEDARVSFDCGLEAILEPDGPKAGSVSFTRLGEDVAIMDMGSGQEFLYLTLEIGK